MANEIVGRIAGIAVGLIVAAALLPTSLQQIATANMTGVSAATVAIFGLIGILGVLSAALCFIGIISNKE